MHKLLLPLFLVICIWAKAQPAPTDSPLEAPPLLTVEGETEKLNTPLPLNPPKKSSGVDSWRGRGFWNIGFSPTRFSTPILQSANTPDNTVWTQYEQSRGGFLMGHMSADYVGDNFTAHFDPGSSWGTTVIFAIAKRLIQDNYSDSIIVDQSGIVFDPMRFGVGGWINDKLGVFGGLQYSYAIAETTVRPLRPLNDAGGSSIYTNPRVGGHCYGINGTAHYCLSDKLMFTYSLFLDRVVNSKGANKGLGIGNHGKVVFALGDSFGFFANIEHRFMRMRPVDEGISEDLSRDFKVFYTPEYSRSATRASIFEFNFGITMIK